MTDKHTLVEKMLYTAEHGIFDACEAGMLFDFDEAAARITALEAREAELVEANQRLRDGYADAVSGYQYILQCHGRLNGVGFERVIDHFAQWVTIPEREDLVAGSHTLARATLAKHQEGEG